MSVVNADTMQAFFGVTAAQAAASGYAPYRPQAGVRDLRANVALPYQVMPRWSMTAAVSVDTLVGDARDSPLTRDASTVSGVLAWRLRSDPERPGRPGVRLSDRERPAGAFAILPRRYHR